MSDKKKNLDGKSSEMTFSEVDGRATVTTTVTTPEPTLRVLETKRRSPDKDHTQVLTPEEEKVVRMRFGRSLQEHEVLEFAPGATMETRLKLALIESSLLEAFEAHAFDPDPRTGAPRSVIADAIE